jgi:hypothetical protein
VSVLAVVVRRACCITVRCIAFSHFGAKQQQQQQQQEVTAIKQASRRDQQLHSDLDARIRMCIRRAVHTTTATTAPTLTARTFGESLKRRVTLQQLRHLHCA